MYRTGDLARFTNDGNIEFVGRCDTQVKVRGFRVELGEIEATLQAHPSVALAAVIAHEERAGDVRLTAYLVKREHGEAADIAEFLRARLPHYMVPSSFTFLHSLPLGASGKVDRLALPKLALGSLPGSTPPQPTDWLP